MHVVVTGQVRHIAGYRLLLERLASGRRTGALSSVTLVHWKDQGDLAAELARLAPDAADRTILLDEPELKSPGHVFHQAYALASGLADRDDADWVLRLRPDIYLDEAFLPNMAGFVAQLDRPLWSPFADLTCPFFACDMVFAGRAAALRAQTNYSVEPYVARLPTDAALDKVHSHEPEVQRWLHPARTADWRTRACWRLFPSLGLSTPLRTALLARLQDWDVYQATRSAWLDYIGRNLTLGGLADIGRVGLVRAAAPDSPEAQVLLLDLIQEVETLASDAALAHERGDYLWTTDAGRAADFGAFLKSRARPERPVAPEEALLELAGIWADALADPDRPPRSYRKPYALGQLRF